MGEFDEQLKRELARVLLQFADGWTQILGAAFLGVDQACLSRLRNGQLRGISSSRLLRLIARHGYDVEITFRKYRRERGRWPRVTVSRIISP